jgi:hypothetical protein
MHPLWLRRMLTSENTLKLAASKEQRLEDNDELHFSQNHIRPPATTRNRIAPDFALDIWPRWRITRLRFIMRIPSIRKIRPTPRKRKLRAGGQQVCNFQFMVEWSKEIEGANL